MKKLLFVPLGLVVIGLIVSAWLYFMTLPVTNSEKFSNILIPKGSSAGAVGARLQKAGFIKSALVFKIYITLSGQAGSIQSGEFRLSPSFSLAQIIKELMRGPLEIWVTIPEGLRHEEIAEKFTKSFEQDDQFFQEFLNLTKNLEGRLYPDTYLFPKEASAGAVVGKMNRTFDSKILALKSSSGLTNEQNIILASILERETITDEERPVVAGILLKRLNAGWPLQADATVQYATGTTRCKGAPMGCEWWKPLIKDDLAINSPYNSYKFQGLPPTPICNPGISSLEASYNPVESEYWYYIHDNKGGIHYAKTLEEHNDNIYKYLGK